MEIKIQQYLRNVYLLCKKHKTIQKKFLKIQKFTLNRECLKVKIK